MQQSSTPEDCMPLFDRHGTKKNRFSQCTRIVPFVKLGEDWISLSIDLLTRCTTLIHPKAASRPSNEVEEEFKPICERLTYAALSNMAALSMRHIKPDNWSYAIALKPEHTFHPNNAGVLTFYYSIPRDNQFMVVTDAPVKHVKQVFVHELVKMSFGLTSKRLKRCGVRNVDKPNGRKLKEIGGDRIPKRRCNRRTEAPTSECSYAGSCDENDSGRAI